MVWEHFGGVFSVFSPLFGFFYPPIIVKNAYFGHFGAISRDFGPFLAIYDGSTIYKKTSKIYSGRNHFRASSIRVQLVA